MIVEQIRDHHDSSGHTTVALVVIDAWERANCLWNANRRPDVAAMWRLIDSNDGTDRSGRADDAGPRQGPG